MLLARHPNRHAWSYHKIPRAHGSLFHQTTWTQWSSSVCVWLHTNMLSIWQTWNWKNIQYKNKTTCSFLLQKLCQEIHHRNICLPDLLYRREMTWDFTIKKSQITLQTSWTTLEDQAYSSCSFLFLIEISNQQIFAWDSSPMLFFCWHQNIPQFFPRKPGAWPWVWSLSISILLVSLSNDSQLTFGKKNDDFAVKSREENIFKKSLPWLWEEWFMI